MGAFDNVSNNYSAAKFSALGDSVAGRIVGFDEYQTTDFQTKQPKFFPSGDPVMGVHIHLEQSPGDPSSRVTIFADKLAQLKAIKAAFTAAGRSGLTEGDDLALSHTHMDGRAKGFKANYVAN